MKLESTVNMASRQAALVKDMQHARAEVLGLVVRRLLGREPTEADAGRFVLATTPPDFDTEQLAFDGHHVGTLRCEWSGNTVRYVFTPIT